MRIIIILFLGLNVFSGCREKPIACISSDPVAPLNKAVHIQSCSSNLDAHQWQVEGGGETIVSGGGFCDNYIVLSFATTGEKTVKLIVWKFKKKSKTTCAEGLDAGKTDESNYNITVE